ncbi:MAG TPA: helicase HerA-like domain-containing protein [Candidatus Limnocylindrales bacterium]|nr:helicase HerA-like domain-containing protein [Candidatus Limnocylindrales bacterium]
MDKAFSAEMLEGYELDEPSITLGAPMLDGEVLADVHVRVALSRINRHGLIAGATGTGKTKTLQLIAEQLAAAGVPVFAVDVKGDLSGIGAPGDAANPKIVERSQSIGWAFKAAGQPLEVLSLSGTTGAHVRASVSSFGPLLLGKVLDLNETQTSILSLVFRYCDDQHLPLLDLADLRTTLKFLGSDDGKAVLEELGGISPASLGVILRSIVTLEQEGADVFFGEPEFEVTDLLRTSLDGRGTVTLLEVADVMDKPRLFSTFVLWMLAQLYETLPEVGDLPKPKLAFFFDEAHLLFDDASDALMEQIERTARLIRSKGVGVYFVTQAPTDVPSSVLSQLGNRVQHALRAFTPDDADALRKTARTFPMTDHYDVERTITSLGIGEALVTVLSPKGIPTPLAATRLIPPASRMAPLTPDEIAQVVALSPLQARYGAPVDRESAHEIITARLAAAHIAAQAAVQQSGVAVPGAGAGRGTGAGAADPYGGMTRREYEAQIRREAREAERERNRQVREAERARRTAERERKVAERARQRSIDSAIRTGGRVITSRAGQSLIRGVFDTIFGGGRR